MQIDFSKMTEQVLTYTQALIDRFGPRQAGSKACQSCADALHEELGGFADSTRLETFGVQTGAFLGWIRILVTFYVIGTVMLWLNLPQVTAGLLFVGVLIMVFQFFLYKHAIDFLFPKKVGKNVVATVEPEGEVKQQIIIAGHHDSASIFNFFIHQPKLYALRVMGGIGILVAVWLFSVAASFIGSATVNMVVAIVSSIGALLVLQLWFFYSSKCTPGAGDNLVASCMAVEALRQIAKDKKDGKALQHTRVMAVSFDAEEEGLRGAYAFTKQNKAMLQSFPTYLYNIDCPYYLKDMFYLTSDINTSVQLSEDFANLCAESAKKLGYEAKVKPIAFLTGGTDAAELAKVGVSATTLMAMPWDNTERAAVYHTPNDTVDAIEEKTIQAGLEVFYEVVQSIDKQ